MKSPRIVISLILLFCFSKKSFADVLTPEMLFSNSNSAIYHNTLKVSFSLFDEDKKKRSEGEAHINFPRRSRNIFWGIFFSERGSKRFRTHLEEDERVEESFLVLALSTLLLKAEKRSLFYLKERGIDFPLNQELRIAQRYNLLLSQKNYLERNRRGKNGPFKQRGNRSYYRDLLKRGLYNWDPSVSLVRQEGKFFWKVAKKGFEALFSNKKHKLHKLKYENGEHSFYLNFSHFKNLNGIYWYPERVSLSIQGKKAFIKIKNISYREVDSDSFLNFLSSESKQGRSREMFFFL